MDQLTNLSSYSSSEGDEERLTSTSSDDKTLALLSSDLTLAETESTSPTNREGHTDLSVCLKKNSKSKLSKRLVMEKIHVHNASRKPYKVVLPRVPPTDIRKQYGLMFLNAINHADAQFIDLFFRKFSSRSICLEIGHQPSPLEKLQTHFFQNPNDVVRSFEGLTVSVPDRVLTMKRAVLITRSNTFKTEIIVDFKVVGTKIFDIDPLQMAAVIESMKDKMGAIENIRKEDVLKIMAESFTPPTPRPLEQEGRYVITINDYRESCKIDKILFQTRPCRDSTLP